ncbi:hypothetical protein BS17DRAFT_790071 [Gyrodon lividus]|nr:hypothetical protein BS17DRAFT_790071 [Gyrodon lividus]
MSSSGTESQHAESSRSSIARSSGSGLVPDQNPWSSSDVAGPTKKKRSFLTRWSKPPSPQQLSVPMESLNIVVGDGHSAELNSHQSQDLPSMQNDDPKESPLSPCSPRTSSPVISTSFSGSHSVRSSRHSALSLPIVPRDQEYVSFLEF